MMRRTVQGLSFKVWSPSLWELATDAGHVSLAFTGDLGWAITVQMPNGRIVDRQVPSFQAGVTLLASRHAA